MLFTVNSTAFYFFILTQPLTYFTVQLLYTVKEKGGKPDRKQYSLPYGLRNPYRNLKSENSQFYAHKLQRNCTFMNSAAGQLLLIITASLFVDILCRLVKPALPFRSRKNFQSINSLSQKMSFSSSLLAMQSYENLACSLHTAYTKPRILAGEWKH